MPGSHNGPLMRAPQYGHNKGKKRARQAPKTLAGAALLALRPDAKPRLWRAVGLRGPNEPVPTKPYHYHPPQTALYEDGTYGAPCTWHLHHKSANWVDGVKIDGAGEIVTKRFTVVKGQPQPAQMRLKAETHI